MLPRRLHHLIARLALAWFALALGVAYAASIGGVATPVGTRGVRLSGGQVQRALGRGPGQDVTSR